MATQMCISVSIDELERYTSVMPTSFAVRISKAILAGETMVQVPLKAYMALPDKLAKQKAQEEALRKCAELNNEGMACERLGDITGAVAAYEANIQLHYPAHHAYKRLLVLYRKQKDYKNELRIAQAACRVFPKEQQYKDRREKIKELAKRTK